MSFLDCTRVEAIDGDALWAAGAELDDEKFVVSLQNSVRPVERSYQRLLVLTAEENVFRHEERCRDKRWRLSVTNHCSWPKFSDVGAK